MGSETLEMSGSERTVMLEIDEMRTVSGERAAKSGFDAVSTDRSSSLGRRIIIGTKGAADGPRGDPALNVQLYSVCWAAQQRS
jgi:hypothetical protein